MSSRVVVRFNFKPVSESETPTWASQYRAVQTDIMSISKFNQTTWYL